MTPLLEDNKLIIPDLLLHSLKPDHHWMEIQMFPWIRREISFEQEFDK